MLLLTTCMKVTSLERAYNRQSALTNATVAVMYIKVYFLNKY